MTADETWGEELTGSLGRAGSGPDRRDTVVRLDDHRPGRSTDRPAPPADVLRRRRAELDAVADHEAVPVAASELHPDRYAAGRPWAGDDLAVAGLAGALGFAAAWSDAPAGSWVRTRLDALGDAELLRNWEATRDAAGPGARGHRHDFLRPVAALRRIRDDHVEGVRPSDGLAGALVPWVQSLVTELVPDLVSGGVDEGGRVGPGWARLEGLPADRARRVARYVAGDGCDVAGGTGAVPARPGVPPLPLLAVGTLVRAHVHGRAWHERESLELTVAERVLRDELLLVAHGLTGAACLGRAVATALTTGGPLALHRVDVPVLVRLGALGHTVASERCARLPEWVELLDRLDAPWDLELAADIDARAPVVLPGLA